METAVKSGKSDGTPRPPRTLRAFEDGLQIVTFDPAHRAEFKRLNVAWLERYFKVEPIDERVLGNPEAEILAPGGEILFAKIEDQVVGTVALKAEEAGGFELTKMAVDDLWKGKGYGKRLLDAACELAAQRGAKHVILYSQRSLQVAVNMYSKYGFVELPNIDARYARCDIKMERKL